MSTATTITPTTPATPPPFTADGGRSLIGLGLAARLPTAMTPLALLLAVSGATGSFTLAGSVVALASLAGAAGGPLAGMVADRTTQRLVVLTVTVAQSVGLLAMAVALRVDAPVGWLLLATAAVGFFNPVIGSMARSQWAARSRPRADRHNFLSRAMGWEAASDEISYVLGPIVASLVTGYVGSVACLLTVMVLALVTHTAFALLPQPQALPSLDATATAAPQESRLAALRRLGPVVGAVAAVGVVFGSTQTALAARFAATDQTEITGLVYACLGIGSALSGVAVARFPSQVPMTTRMTGFGAALAVSALLLQPAPSPWFQALACFVVGLSVAPVLASAYVLAELRSPAGASTAVMTVLATMTATGVGLGAAGSGPILEHLSVEGALALPVLAGLVVTACGLAARRGDSRV
ncbi:MAG TPA: MFS transporter [Nocardioidaceae bacterium]|nr:MFS transporter [Nocardioidaceae bacterium]